MGGEGKKGGRREREGKGKGEGRKRRGEPPSDCLISIQFSQDGGRRILEEP